MKLNKTKKFLMRVCFETRPPLINDCLVTYCKFCDEGAWQKENIKHTKDCEVGGVLKELKI